MEEEKPSGVSFTSHEMMFGVATLLGAVQGILSYRWYPRYVIENETLFPIRDPSDLSIADRDWALQTREIRNWKYSAYGHMFMYGSQHLLWLANILLDNEGGALHSAFTRYRQVMLIAPVISVV